MKRPAPQFPPFPLEWTCDVCQTKGLTVQRLDDRQAVACPLCERILCGLCSSRHFVGGQLCRREQQDRKAG